MNKDEHLILITYRNVKVGCDYFSSLPDLQLVRHEPSIDSSSRGPHGTAKFICQIL